MRVTSLHEAPRDPLDPRSLRDGGRRAIPWEEHDAASLPEQVRRRVGLDWLARTKQEHLAVGAFSEIALELAAVGVDSVVLALITQAAADEVRHADLCRRLAVSLLGAGEVPARFHGVPRIPRHPDVPPRERALLHVVEMCCLNETFTGVYLTEMLNRATNVTARAAIESLLEDEIDHGRVGWAHLSTACREGWGSAIHARLPDLLDRTVAEVVCGPRAEEGVADESLASSYGFLSPRAGAAVYRHALAEVILPGFEAAGLDVGVAWEHARRSRYV